MTYRPTAEDEAKLAKQKLTADSQEGKLDEQVGRLLVELEHLDRTLRRYLTDDD